MSLQWCASSRIFTKGRLCFCIGCAAICWLRKEKMVRFKTRSIKVRSTIPKLLFDARSRSYDFVIYNNNAQRLSRLERFYSK
jgi:hypothetical protein